MQNALPQQVWYVGYTLPNAERKVFSIACQMGFESFLPLHKVVRQWSDRKKILEVPLFPNYIFIKTTPIKRFELLAIHSLVKFVVFEGKPAQIPDHEIDVIKKVMKGKVEVLKKNNFNKGDKVRIIKGQLEGTEGVLIKEHGKSRLSIQLEILQQTLFVDIEAEFLKVIV